MLIIWVKIEIKEINIKDHKYYEDTIDFCEKWDQVSFDPNYKSMTLEEFNTNGKKNIFKKTIFFTLNFFINYYQKI